MEWTRGRTIGQGSSASVSVATLLSTGDVLAVKSVDFTWSETLQREQQILSSLTSPYIVNYRGFDVTTENGKPLYNLFMEFSPRGTLADEIRRHGGCLGEEMIAKYTRQILLGLDYIHSKGLVHCDIKGRNVLVGENTTARIADFGCARWVADTAAPISGTPNYMAPEVARGDEQGSAADVWAVGCTVVEMATGQSPWGSGGDPVSLLYRIGFSGDSPKFPCSLSDKMADFLSKCLGREPRERLTAAELLNHPFLLESCSSDEVQDSKFSNSPTSILDLSYWSETELTSPTESTGRPKSSVSAVDRIKRLSCSAAAADWSWDGRWVAVREEVGGEHLIALRSGADSGSVGGNAEELESGVGGHPKWDLLGGEIIIIGHNSIVKRNDIELIPSFVS